MDLADKHIWLIYFRRTDLFKCIAFERRIALRTFQSEGISRINMDVSKTSGTPKSSILIGFSIINHQFWDTPIFGNTYMFWIASDNDAPMLRNGRLDMIRTNSGFYKSPRYSQQDFVSIKHP